MEPWRQLSCLAAAADAVIYSIDMSRAPVHDMQGHCLEPAWPCMQSDMLDRQHVKPRLMRATKDMSSSREHFRNPCCDLLTVVCKPCLALYPSFSPLVTMLIKCWSQYQPSPQLVRAYFANVDHAGWLRAWVCQGLPCDCEDSEDHVKRRIIH